MANFNCFTTSNYFKVKDLDKFKEELEQMDGTDLFEYNNNTICVATYGDLYSYTKDDEEYSYNDYLNFIQKHIEDEEKVFISSVGHEKLRYLAADCTIVTKNVIKYHDLFNNISKEYNNGFSIF